MRKRDVIPGMKNRIGKISTGAFNPLKNESGATSIEYALLVAVIVIGVIGAGTVMFGPLQDFFLKVVQTITDYI